MQTTLKYLNFFSYSPESDARKYSRYIISYYYRNQRQKVESYRTSADPNIIKKLYEDYLIFQTHEKAVAWNKMGRKGMKYGLLTTKKLEIQQKQYLQ